ncbi:lipid asymmetry maintenance protein MlaB [Streptomyces nitrosporeus]|uniref:STAS domain-containing protein n=1 Tax=Streptomyces nitrosporeus TaxID=28894 RepID=UPI0039A1B784
MNPWALALTGRVTRADVPRLCDRLETRLALRGDRGEGAPVTVVDCDVGGVTHADLALVEALARLALVVRRAGGAELRLRRVSPGVHALLGLVGLTGVIGVERADSAGAGRVDVTGVEGAGPPGLLRGTARHRPQPDGP